MISKPSPVDLEEFISPRTDISWLEAKPVFDPWWSKVLIDHSIANDLRRQHLEIEYDQRALICDQVARSVYEKDRMLFDKWMRNFTRLSEELSLSHLETFAPLYKLLCPQMTDDFIRQRRVMVTGIFSALRVPHTEFCQKHMDSFAQTAVYFYPGQYLIRVSEYYARRLKEHADQSQAALRARVIALVRELQIMSADDVGNLFGRVEEYTALLQILRALMLEFRIDRLEFIAATWQGLGKNLDISPCLLPIRVA